MGLMHSTNSSNCMKKFTELLDLTEINSETLIDFSGSWTGPNGPLYNPVHITTSLLCKVCVSTVYANIALLF